MGLGAYCDRWVRCLRWGQRQGYEVVGETGRGDQEVELVRSLGADEVIDYKKQAFEKELRGYDMALGTLRDEEIEKAAGLSVQEIFERHGEPEFRRGERRVIERLLNGPPLVLATGGGAYMDPDTRALLKEKATTVWLRADLDLIWKRVNRRDTRPLLKRDNPRQVLADLLAARGSTGAVRRRRRREELVRHGVAGEDRKSTRLNSSH